MKPSSASLAKYDAMVLAIEACERIDEVKNIRDQARAIQVYAAQAKNTEAEAKAARVRIRAERKTGELLKATKQSSERNHSGQPTKEPSGRPTVLADLGISRDQSSQWQKLVEIPTEKFEAALADTNVIPSTAGVLDAVKPLVRRPLVKYDRDALMAHGHIMDFRNIMLKPAAQLYSLMAQYQRDELAALIPQVIAWLQEMK